MGLFLTVVTTLLIQAGLADPACQIPGPRIPSSLHSIHGALVPENPPPPLDQIGSDTPSYTAPERLMGFSYYVGSGNERFEKLEGYDDIYLYIDHYEPSRHPLNRLFLGSSAIIKIDRSQTPPRYVYLSREKHVGSKSGEELKDVKNVNEHLCSLNSACDRNLKAFNLQARTREFDARIASEYKASIRKRFTDLLLVDTYATEPGIASGVRSVLDRLEAEAQGSPDQINSWISSEMKKITESKIGTLTREQYQSKVKGQENERALEYISYRSLTNNVQSELEKRSHHSKKEAILSYCATRDIPECRIARVLKSDLDGFQSRRQLLPRETGLPAY
jgi:hypothetical protein